MPGEYYQPVYLTLVTFITIYQCMYYRGGNYDILINRSVVSPVPSLLCVIALTFFIGLRPKASCFIDSNNQASMAVAEKSGFSRDQSLEFGFCSDLFCYTKRRR